MDIKNVCNVIDQIIAGMNNPIQYRHIHLHLDDALKNELSYEDFTLICETILKIAQTKNRIIRHLEKEFWRFIKKVPCQIILLQRQDISTMEMTLSPTKYKNTNKRILSRLVKLIEEVLKLKADNSKGCELRRAGSLMVLEEMLNYYDIPNANHLFMGSLNSKNKKEQFAALEGLETYYKYADDELDDDLVQTLYKLKNETYEREIATTCLQILINTNVISQATAVYEMNVWKDKHNY